MPGIGYGDIKTSGYFLDDFVDETPAADFYITRIYAPQLKQYQYIVFLTLSTWQHLSMIQADLSVFNVKSLADAPAYFPQAVWICIENLDWILLEYSVWLRLVLQVQKELTKDE